MKIKTEKIAKFEWTSFKTKKAAISIYESLVMIISIFAFAFIIGGMSIGMTKTVSAQDQPQAPPIPKGCCVLGKDGSICQEMDLIDTSLCNGQILGSSCNEIEPCQIGCCYNNQEGSCSFNSPKQKCEQNGGNWSNSANCNIQQCQLGCCILGDQASITTTRECSLISQELNFQKNWQQPLDADGSCNSKIGLEKKGACVSDTGDFSGEKDCTFTTKSSCTAGEFYEGYLCTAKELNTICKPARNTTCVSDKDQIYFLDTCGNTANVYDANKINDSSYWEQIISPSSSCSPASTTCGNCDYLTGSVCHDYRLGKDPKPVMGNEVCRNMNCLNGRQNGESWCISDYSNTDTPGIAPVGSRWFRGVCNEGEISIEPCADFNQETCIGNTGTGEGGTSFSEAKCWPNGWRNCIAANQKDNYADVKAQCDNYPDDCVMFLDTEIGSKYEGLPGFKKNVDNSMQGSANGVGKDANKVIAYCVPKNTPGMVFWATNDNLLSSLGQSATGTQQTQQQSYTGIDYGGSYDETKSICALGSFTCVKTKKKSCLTCSFKDDENVECFDKDKAPVFMSGLNDRCSMLGPCAVKENIAGSLGSNEITNTTVSATKIDADGTQSKESTPNNYLPDSYKSGLTSRAEIVAPGSLSTLTSLVVLALITGRDVDQSAQQAAQGNVAGNQANAQQQQAYTQLGLQLAETALPLFGAGNAATAAAATTTISPGTNIVSGTFTSGTLNVPLYSYPGGTGQLTSLTMEPTSGAPIVVSPNPAGGSFVVENGVTYGSPGVTATTPVVGTNAVIGLSAGNQIVPGTVISGGDISVSMQVGSKLSYELGGKVTTLEMTENGLTTTTNGVTTTATNAVGSNIPNAAVVDDVTEGVAVQNVPGATGTAAAPAAQQAGQAAKVAGQSTQGLSELSQAGITLLAAIAAYFIVGAIGKANGWTPGEIAAWSSIAASGATIVTTAIFIALYDWSPAKIVTLIIAVIMIIYSILSYSAEYKYEIVTYTCEPWQAPQTGDCNSCNSDVRTCSEYRCRSLGMNCHYFNDNGEPGYCATLSDIWSAKITPWPEALNSEDKYTQVTDTHFKIEETDKEKVAPDIPLQFGIITDKPATCKIDSKHTQSFDEMATTMQIDNSQCETSGCSGSLGTHHKVVLSPSISNGSSAVSTLSLVKDSENNYYIRCKNFAGQTNTAEFAVKVITDKGEDLTPPLITSFSPDTGSYLKVGVNSSLVTLYVNEPSECRYSQSVDNVFEEMTGSLICVTDETAAVLGNWPCYTLLQNLTAGDNKFYFQCEDQPNLPNDTTLRRNINRNSKDYTLKVCSTGLNITRVFPNQQIVTGQSPISAELDVETSGCINGGVSNCDYRFENGQDIPFLNTNGTTHSQVFTSLTSGAHNITITCQDDAGNIARANATITVVLDNNAPIITRAYSYANMLVVTTNEKSLCKYVQNTSLGCDFDYDLSNATIMDGTELLHATSWSADMNYFIKCRDNYNNTDFGCGIALSTYKIPGQEYAV